MRAVSLFLFASVFAAGTVAAQQFSSLEERMTEQEFRAAGLDRLSPEELASLNAWIAARLGTVPTTVAPADRVGFKPEGGIFGDDGERGEIYARIEGEFTGWSGRTVFKLDNGQWWQQTDGTTFSVPRMTNPGVEIQPAMMGSWLLKVDGYNRPVRVTRIR